MSDFPAPYRGGTYNDPTVRREGRNLTIEVVIPNEDPANEDDLTVIFTFDENGMNIESVVSSDISLGNIQRSYKEWSDNAAHF